MTNEQLVILIRNAVSPADLMIQLWQQNYGLVRKIVNRYKSLDDIEDLLQEGFLGLHEAVRHYDPDTGVPFVNYAAFWIRQTIGRYVKRNGTIRIPEHAVIQVRAYRRMVSQWESEFGRKPTEWEMCRYLDVTLEMLRQIEKDGQMGKIQSLDKCVGEENDTQLYELLPDHEDAYNDALDELLQEELKTVIWPMVDSLPDHQPEVLRMRFQDGKTLKETGNVIGATVEQTRQLQAKAMRTLRMPRYSRMLRPFLDDDVIRSYGMSGTGMGAFERTWTSSTERAVLQLEEIGERV